MKFEHAQAVGDEIRRVSLNDNCMLITAYSRVLGTPNDPKKDMLEPEQTRNRCESDEDMSTTHEWTVKEPLPCAEVD